ncbi:sensor histidine kinase [Flavobacterium sp. I3-2]|uniref:sensor histidine kinase n=1 Tax=Flavobacterium sp. I3-2 TaxID=2748319 RepID=UPI0015AF0C76|nr:ATP-binding protein [Flavobacterium sp. I3-2]
MEIWKTPESVITWLFIILIIFLVLLFFIITLIKVSYKKAVEKKQALFDEKIKNEQNLKNAIIEIQDQERKEIASELHDQISNKLNLVVLNLNNLTDNESNSIKQIKDDIRKIIDKNRDISHYLFPVEIENIGIIFTLQDLSLKYRTSNFKIDLLNRTEIKFKDKLTEIQLYRVIQESLTNTLKYSKATIFNIHFRTFKNRIFVVVSDNGIGFNINEIQKGIGLTGIETRLSSIDATYKLKSSLNKGTQLIIVL